MQKAFDLTDPTWEHQKGESAIAYKCFTAYRDLGASRTLERAWRFVKLTWTDFMRSDFGDPHPPSDRTIGNRFAKYSAQWRWVQRAEEYDAHLDHILISVREQASRETAHLLEARRVVVEAREAEMSDVGTKVIMDALRAGATHRVFADGKYVGDEINEAVVRVLPQLIKEVRILGRLAAGMPTEGARMPTPPFDTSGGADIDVFLKTLGGGGEAGPSRGVPDSVESR